LLHVKAPELNRKLDLRRFLSSHDVLVIRRLTRESALNISEKRANLAHVVPLT